MSAATKINPIPTRESIANDTLVLILAGGRGSRLHEMTDRRAKPAVYFGGAHRIIDFALSNCLNSGLLKIGVITQYEAHSLLRHLQHGWSFLPRERGHFVDMLPARQQLNDSTWYRGTADAVWQNVPIMKDHYRPKYVLILAGDHIYKMDYMRMIEDHIEFGGKATVGCIEVPKEDAKAFGVMAVNDKLKVEAFVEKPADPPTMPDKPNSSLASMGIYVFDADYLYEILEREASYENTSHDFGKDIIPAMVEEGLLYAHPFERSSKGRNTQGLIYWRDVGTLESYWAANIDLVSEKPQLNMFDQSWPIRTVPKQTLPTKFFYKHPHKQTIDNSLIGGSGVIIDAEISNSVLFDHVRVEEGSKIEYAVILPQVKIGKNCVLRRCIIDRNCKIPDGMQIGVDLDVDRQRFRISSQGNIVLVTEPMLEKLLAKQQQEDTAAVSE
ncbi:glucose-1-phosphate adenylyltransferase [Gallibacterium salpingitidis]|uniref:Glucose-1-phosphate adenylyltransferase n=1 Tax=Gallibacterium salpingitidis TaxID=505341 RepID=A0A1A7QDG1_9PAST|nr:glucose-1-phosphate adenylyltransferase [Gallibacterium salpingitidis]OBW96298.1 glucose-1-phosphate adenylyltransferase [Gallibacterium salpingitidis]OBX07937.1 glucose-1-phosphate adenylyltransferase [Gallibacterium salpingitidis]OBX11470.1 glucose-1-phosphate adenylyltransferase [Gallibacterium salpingitidis]